jgi:CubicO group peptidase (beta-lactamase class C family)
MNQVDATGIAEVEAIFADWFGSGSAPGLAWGIVADGELVHAAGLGELHAGAGDLPGADASFRIASMTKSFVAAMILLLRDEGRLRLDDRVNQHVPELQGLSLPTADSPAPTLRDLMAMRSGYPEDDPWADRLEAMPNHDYLQLISTPKTHARVPGVAFDYSNIGFTLLGQVIANVCADAYQDVIRERLLEPLGLHDTTWSGDAVEPTRLAAGYHLIDGVWVEQPIQEPGAFSALGGLHSTVADLAVWVQGFIDAFPPRDAPDAHPLSRASRREMQQIVTAIPLQVESGQTGALSVRSDGYCLGLLSMEDLRSGRTVGHSGGYPGFGSHMRWHPATGIGLIALANGRYARPSAALLPALEALVRRAPQRTRVEPLPAALELKTLIDAALAAGEITPLLPHLADNIDLDEALDRRAGHIAELPARHGTLTPGDVAALTPTQVTWWLEGERGRVGVEIMLTPEVPPRLQKLAIESVHPTNEELDGAVAGVLEALRRGTDHTPLVVPIRRASWVACDGARTGAVLLEGAHIDVRIVLDLDADPVATLEPAERFPSPW